MKLGNIKTALIYDRVNKFGGAERVLLSLHKIFPQAPIFTLVYNPKTARWAKNIKVYPTFFNKITFFQNRHELLGPFASIGFESLDLSAYDLVISVTSEAAKAVITSPQTLHLCYCLTPTRYLWSGESVYSQDWKLKIFPRFMFNWLKKEDQIISHRPDHYLAISAEVRTRISLYYHQNSDIVFPPVEDLFFQHNLIPISQRKHYLLVSRLVPYKKAELVIKAFNVLNLPLSVVGTGSEMSKLKTMAKRNITFYGDIPDRQLLQLYTHAKATIFPQNEDFGIVPLESQAAGTPVIAFNAGGAKETIVPGETGIFFDEQSQLCLQLVIHSFESTRNQFRPEQCRLQARKFTTDRFIAEFSAKVETLWQKHQNQSKR